MGLMRPSVGRVLYRIFNIGYLFANGSLVSSTEEK